MPRRARRIGTNVNFLPATWLPVVFSSGVSISTASSGRSFVTSYAISIAISFTSCLKSRVLVCLSRKIVSLCWISGCDSTVRLGKSRAARDAMSGEATRPVAGARPAGIFTLPTPQPRRMIMRKTLLNLAALAVCTTPLTAQSVDSLVAKYIQASGGLAKIQALQSLRRTGRFTGGGGFEAVVVQENKRPSSVREEFSIQGMTGINLPFAYESGPKGSSSTDRSKITYDKIEANVSLENARFTRPGARP